MEIEYSLKNIIIFLLICFILVNVVFVFIVILEKIKNSGNEALSEAQKQRNLIEYMKKNVNFNNTLIYINIIFFFFYFYFTLIKTRNINI